MDPKWGVPTRSVGSEKADHDNIEELFKLEQCHLTSQYSKLKRVKKSTDDGESDHPPPHFALSKTEANTIILNNYCCSDTNCLLKTSSLDRATTIFMDCR
jgi:hypothetical protein